jgi:hypothetical protein
VWFQTQARSWRRSCAHAVAERSASRDILRRDRIDVLPLGAILPIQLARQTPGQSLPTVDDLASGIEITVLDIDPADRNEPVDSPPGTPIRQRQP